MIKTLLGKLIRNYSFSIDKPLAKFVVERNGLLHLGANSGNEAEAYDRLGFKKVIWVEGYKKFYSQLKERIKKYPAHEAYNFMVSNIDGEKINFSLASNAVSSTLFPISKSFSADFPQVKFIKQATNISTYRVDTYFKKNNIDISALSVLVIDLEGAELMALKSLGKKLNQFKYILTEISITNNFIEGPLLKDIDAFLYKKGYKRIFTKVHLASGDAMYKKIKVSKIDKFIMSLSCKYFSLLYKLHFYHSARALKNIFEPLYIKGVKW